MDADKGRTFRVGGAKTSKKEGINKQKTNRGERQLPNAMLNKYTGYNNGGIMKHDDMAKDMPMMKKVAKKEVKAHEKSMHKMASGGKVGQLSKADGCATKGKSKGKMVKMNKGGMC
jgi:hypothetical protein